MRKALIGGLAAIVIAAAGTGAYSAFASSSTDAANTATADTTAGVATGGQAGHGYHGGSTEARGDGTGVPSPQANVGTLETLSGTVVSFDGNLITFDTDQGTVTVQLGNSYFVEGLGISLEPGDEIEVTGFWEDDTTFAAQQIVAGDDVFVLREETGRPLWAGGGHNGGGPQH